MKPSEAFEKNREFIREAVAKRRTANPRIFGSVLHGTDRDDSDVDILVDALPGASLFDLGGLQADLEDKLGVRVQVVLPTELHRYYRDKVLARLSQFERRATSCDLDRARTAARDLIQITSRLTRAEFLDDTVARYASVMCAIALGESIVRIGKHSPDLLQAHPEVPWAQIRGFRNRAAHGYFDLDFTVVWEAASVSAPALLRLIETMNLPD